MPTASLEGKGIIVTGASCGLGKEIARACLQNGAHVYICARDGEALECARAELATHESHGRVFAQQADVSNPESVAALFDSALRDLPNLVGLVNNAGVQGPMGLFDENEWGEWFRAVEINLFGTVLCCQRILPILRKANYGKIINLSGGGATAPRPRMSAYAASKAAVVRLTENLAVEYREHGIDVNAIAPGALNTRMLDEFLAAGSEKVGTSGYDQAMHQKQDGGSSLERAAQLCVLLLSSQSDGITGKLISAVWDPWESLPQRRDKLQSTDVFTLRRIGPKDRGMDWDQA